MKYLFKNGIIHRDLKPENVIIDEDGYPKLMDFGISKIISGRTFTIVGTPHYMAPEVIIGKGYSLPVDYWSLGVMLYEFVCCKVPFGDDEEDPYAIYEKVLERKLTYPGFVSPKMPCRPVIEQLLHKSPVLRNGGSMENLKAHAWFNGLNWEMLINKQVQAPFVPKYHDYSKEIESALKGGSLVEEAICREEAVEDLHDTSKRRPKNVPFNWDQNF